MTLKAVKSNLLLAECTGINTKWYRVLAFGLGCAIAGFTGSLTAHFFTYISPSSFTWWKTVDVLFANVVGGIGNMWGVFIGSIIVASLPELLRGFVAWQVALYGLILVLVVRFMPGGLVSLIPKIQHSQRRQQITPLAESTMSQSSSNIGVKANLNWVDPPKKMLKDGVLLRVENLTKYFGGLAAVNGVSFKLKQGEILGLIGPNGAGKTTLYNLISGVIRPNKGRVLFKEKNIVGLPSHRISRLGITRTFQLTNLYTEAAVRENILRATSYRSGVSFWSSFLRLRRNDQQEACREIDLLLNSLGLDPYRDELPPNLPYGIQKQVQFAIAIATKPEVILLDEPVSGMNPTEATWMANLIKGVQESGITIIIVEHNMNFVMNTCDQIIVLNHGVKIAEGPPDQIRLNPTVIEAYLGVEDAT